MKLRRSCSSGRSSTTNSNSSNTASRIFLTDNGREFDNQFFQDMAQNLNIVARTTTAQSPWSNGLNERHSGVLGEMVMKTLEDARCNFEVALS